MSIGINDDEELVEYCNMQQYFHQEDFESVLLERLHKDILEDVII